MNKIIYKKIRGSLTVEATLVLPLVIITLLFTVNILNICMVHLCMQQALNNTAKVISQDSYILYRFAKEDNYSSFIENIGKINEGYQIFENEAKITKTGFDELQTSAAETVNSFLDLGKPLKNKGNNSFIEILSDFSNKVISLFNNVKSTINKFKEFSQQLKNLATAGKENGIAIVQKLISDTLVGASGGAISYVLFEKYRKDLGVPASKISELNILNSSLNSDGSFTIAINYLYNNPFSFVNQKSFEYSVINKKIRMTNIITIKPFIGKNGSSLVGSSTPSTEDDEE